MGVAVGDYDNDGRPDLFVSRLMTYSLYRNQGDGTFEDVTQSAGLAGRRDNPTSAAFADLDNDGDLDLYVCHYMIWDPAHPSSVETRREGISIAIPARLRPRPTTSFATTAAGLSTSPRSRAVAETEGAAWASSPPTSTAIVASTSSWPTTAPRNYLFRNQGGFSLRGDRPPGRRGRAVFKEDTRREWAWRAAISTATAGPT